jgi:hypothetical protein
MNDEEFILTRNQRIYKRTLISKSKMSAKLSFEEIERHVYDKDTEVFIRYDNPKAEAVLTKVASYDERIERWNSDFKRHLNLDEDKNTDDFEKGYFYFVNLWKMKLGKVLIVLTYCH